MRQEPLLDPAVVQEDMRIRSVPEQVYRVIRHAIVSGRFRPGEWLRQRDLAIELSVGVSSVREALNRLAAQGYLVTETNRGFRTVIPTLEHMLDHGEVLQLLEPKALELAAQHISPQELARMRELLPGAIFGQFENPTFLSSEHEFHSIAWRASRREYLAQVLEHTWANYHSLGLLTRLYDHAERDELTRISGTCNVSILGALEAGDGKRTAEACILLWDSDLRLIKRAFERMEQLARGTDSSP